VICRDVWYIDHGDNDERKNVMSELEIATDNEGEIVLIKLSDGCVGVDSRFIKEMIESRQEKIQSLKSEIDKLEKDIAVLFNLNEV